MQTNRPAGKLFRFGPFELDAHTGELRKRGIRIALQDQPLRILAALLERPGDIVSREELCARLWPEGTFVDFEHSLNAAVRRLRVTLGDTAETPRFIETIHRRGYRFLSWAGPVPATPAARLSVLRFVSFSNESGSSLFGEGLTEEILTQLAQHGPASVAVLARTSATNADYVVEGSIRRDGDRARIVAHLIESHGQTHLWAATYDRTLTDVLTMQGEVAAEIARAVNEVLARRVHMGSTEAGSDRLRPALNALRPPLSREAAS
jgi:TolB-like protein